MPSSSWSDLLRARPQALVEPTPLDISPIWRPHDGPQTAFLQSQAYEVLYGGAAGGGKTDALLYGALDQAHLAGYRVLFLRRTYPELREVMDRSLGAFRRLGATWNEQQKRWTFPSGATYEFGYCETYSDVMRYQGQEYTVICYDELGQCSEERIWTYLMSRNRSTDARLSKRMRASANPGGPGHVWLKRRFIDRCAPDGRPVDFGDDNVLSRAFVAARLSDNPTLNANDPSYRQRLAQLPEVTRRQLLDGDWSAGEGLALSELNREVHLVKAFAVPDGWYHWGAFDWGFNHPFVSGWFASDPDADAYLVQSIQGRRLLPHEIAERIMGAFPVGQFRKFHAGHDCWNEQRARGENTPSIADQFLKEGIRLQKANISRVTGLNNFRQYLTYDRADPTRRPPRFRIMDTPANRRVFETLEGMVTDPDRPEDALKVDADDYGTGGDDAYDMCLTPDTCVDTVEGPRPIAGLVGKEGMVHTPWGPRRFHSVRMTQTLALTYRVFTEDRRWVDMTGNHEMLGTTEWMPAAYARKGDEWVALTMPVGYGKLWDESDGYFFDYPTLRGPGLPPKQERLLPVRQEVSASGGMAGGTWPGAEGASGPPQGPRPLEQHAGELGGDALLEALPAPLSQRHEAQRLRPVHAESRQDPQGGGEVAPLAGGARVALGEREARHGDAGEGRPGVRVLRVQVSDDTDARPLLLWPMQDEGSAPGGDGQRDGGLPGVQQGVHVEQVRSAGSVLEALRASTTRIARIVPLGWTPVYNMEVEDAHCFAVNGGLIVHNCRYGLAARPLVGQIPKDDTDFSAFSPEALANDMEQRRNTARKERMARARRGLNTYEGL